MRIIDAQECAAVCKSVVEKAQKFLVLASPHFEFGEYDFSKKVKADKILIIHKQKKDGSADFSQKKFAALKKYVEELRQKGKEIILKNREDISTKCVISEKNAVIGAFAFESPKCYRWEYDGEERDIEHVNFNPEGILKERFETALLVDANPAFREDAKCYNELCLLVSSMVCTDSMERWEEYKRISRRQNNVSELETAERFFEEWCGGWGIETALFADDAL